MKKNPGILSKFFVSISARIGKVFGIASQSAAASPSAADDEGALSWWEGKPRYLVQVPSLIRHGGKSHPAQVTDFSEGGVFAECEALLKPGETVLLEMQLPSGTIVLEGELMHRRMTGKSGYGISWRNISLEQAMALKRIESSLEASGTPVRSTRAKGA